MNIAFGVFLKIPSTLLTTILSLHIARIKSVLEKKFLKKVHCGRCSLSCYCFLVPIAGNEQYVKRCQSGRSELQIYAIAQKEC